MGKEYFEREKELKEYKNNIIRAMSIKKMIEKEKVYDTLFFIRRSNNIQTLKEKLKELNICAPEERLNSLEHEANLK